MSYESPTTQRSDSTGTGTTRSLVGDVALEAAIAVEIVLRLTTPENDHETIARERALALVRDEWDGLSVAFARALRDALEPHGEALRGLTVIATLGDGDPHFILRHIPHEEVGDAGS